MGLNVDSSHRTAGFDLQEARRTWWIIYIQDVELSLDPGRPLSVRSSQMNIDYPSVPPTPGDETSPYPAQVAFIRYLAELAKATREILKLVSAIFSRPRQTGADPYS